jgi:carbamoyltransferase
VNILGINAYHANASAALVADGQLVAAAEEERFNRVKYAAGFPVEAIRFCLAEAGIKIQEIDHVAIPRNPLARLGRKMLYALRLPRFALERAKVMRQFAGLREALAAALDTDPASLRGQFHRVEHHHAHLASAFFVSPFERAAILSADGLGDFASTLWAGGTGNRMDVRGGIAFPHSLGMYYTAITQYLGFWKFGDEYKVMGLAAYGEPAYREEFRRIVRAGRGISFRLGLDYFIHQRNGPDMTWRDSRQSPVLGQLFSEHLERRLGPARAAGEPLEPRHRNVAATQQAVLEEILFTMLNALSNRTKQKALCLAGGVAFNCVANGKIFERTPFEQVYVQPAAGDGGLSVGSAYYVDHQILGRPRSFVMDHAYWGPGFTQEEMRRALEAGRIRSGDFRIAELPEEKLAREVA